MQNASVIPGKEGAEKTARSIFVGNIPYEATEEKLVELFSKAGPVYSFRLVYDRESGKPKGYGFCEYANPAIAASALRNLHNIEFNGRPLRIGPAAGEQNSAEIALTNPSVGPPLENPYGNAVDPSKAPEAISRAVASLPPEQMYELMKQMKLCIQNNPNEARNMLLQNPQLAYALLQAQIVMKIVDPKVAIAMLNRTHDQIPPTRPDNSMPTTTKMQQSADSAASKCDIGAIPQQPFTSVAPNGGQISNQPISYPNDFPMPIKQDIISSGMGMYTGFQPPPPQQPAPFPHMHLHGVAQPSQPPIPPSTSGMVQTPFAVGGIPPPPPPGIPSLDQMNPAISGPGLPQKEQEKLDLIMQVLSLSEEAIAMLPDDQQKSIRILKEQVHKTGVFTQ